MRWCWIDRFVEFQSKRYAKAEKLVSLDGEFMRDHFPPYRFMPKPLIIEGLAQTGGMLVCESNIHSEWSEDRAFSTAWCINKPQPGGYDLRCSLSNALSIE